MNQNNGTITVVHAPVHSGSHSCEFALTNDANGYIYLDNALPSAQSTLYMRTYVRFATAIDSATRFRVMQFHTPLAVLVAYLYRVDASTYKWSLSVNNYAAYYDSAAQAFALDTWYCLEMEAVISDVAGEAHLWLNSSEVINQTGLNMSVVDIINYRLQNWNNADQQTNAQTLYYDDVVVDSSRIGCMAETPASGTVLTCLWKP